MKPADCFILNVKTQEAAHFSGSEVIEYRGLYIVPGELDAHPVWIPAVNGHSTVPARRSCPIIVPGGAPELAEAFINGTSGLPLYAVDGEREVQAHLHGANVQAMPVINIKKLPGLSHAASERDQAIESAMRVVDAYHAFVAGEPMPDAIREAQIRAEFLDNGHDTPAFGGRLAFTGLGGHSNN